MRTHFEIKTIDNSTLDVDNTSRRVKIVISKTGVKDFDSDIIDQNAFTKTIKERGPAAKNLIWHLTDHTPSLKSAVGKFKELSMVNDELIGVTDIPETSWGNDVLKFYESGQINQHSIGFKTIRDEQTENKDVRLIKEVMLYEGSAVLWGANEFTPTVSVGKSLTHQELREKYLSLKSEMESGTYTDEFFLIIESQLKQIEEAIIKKYMEPIAITPPENNDLLKRLLLLKSKI
jgi:HK97 family phage prohead protease